MWRAPSTRSLRRRVEDGFSFTPVAKDFPVGHTSHTVVGLVVVGCLLLVQPAMG